MLSNLLPTRAGEKPHYARVLARAGIPPADWLALARRFGDALIELGTDDARRYGR